MSSVLGNSFSIDMRVRMQPVTLGGQRYDIEHDAVDARLDVLRTVSGCALRLRFDVRLLGACMRCLGEAGPTIEVEAREVDQPGGGEELHSPYLKDGQMDVAGWARDALTLTLPVRLLCRPDCRGLCPVCGGNLNEADPDEHRHDSGGDSRWTKLREWRPGERSGFS